MTCSTEIELGAYVLHALERDEADAVEQHVSGCPTCQHELSSLTSTASWLALLTPRDLEQFDELEPEPHDRPHRRRRGVLLTVVAGVLGAAVVVGGVRASEDQPGPPAPAVVSAVDPATHVEAVVSMSEQDSGTRLSLALTGAYPRGWCSLVARSHDGRTETAATWVADADGTAVVAGTTAFATDDLSELDVVTDTGRLLVRVPVPNHDT
jgi:anti-sigma factor RsiW